MALPPKHMRLLGHFISLAGLELDALAVDTVPLVCGCWEALHEHST